MGPGLRCPLCGGEAGPHMILPHTGVFRCRNRDCDLQFASPQLDDQALSQAYASLYYRPDGSPPVLENTAEPDIRHTLDLVTWHFGPLAGKRLLDYGCGVGTLLKVAHELGMQTTGIEQNSAARDTIHRQGFATVYQDLDACRRSEPGAPFDFIVLCEVIEHLRRPWEELEQLRPLLRSSGQLILLTPNFGALQSRLSGPRWEQRTNLTHLYYFTSRSLAAVLRHAGFDACPLPPIHWYSHHGLLRRQLQRVLCASGLQGGLFFSGQAAGAAVSTA